MPQQVRTEIEARRIKIGDRVLGLPGGDFDVAAVDAKVKWMTITDVAGGSKRIELDSKITVERTEQTKEERDAEYLAARIWSIERAVTQAPVDLAAAREKMLAELDQTWTSHWAYERFVAAKEEARLWAEVAHVWELAQQPEHEARAIEQGEEPIKTIVDAKAYIVRKYRAQLLENFTPTSRSTSVVANAFEDVQREVQLKFVRSRWL